MESKTLSHSSMRTWNWSRYSSVILPARTSASRLVFFSSHFFWMETQLIFSMADGGSCEALFRSEYRRIASIGFCRDMPSDAARCWIRSWRQSGARFVSGVPML